MLKLRKGNIILLTDWGVIGRVRGFSAAEKSVTIEWPNDLFWESAMGLPKRVQLFRPVYPGHVKVLSANEVFERMSSLFEHWRNNVCVGAASTAELGVKQVINRWRLFGTRR